MAYVFDVTGFSGPKTEEGQQYTQSVSALRAKTDGELDVVLTGDGNKKVLDLLQEATQELVNLTAPAEPESNWDELLSTPSAGVEVTITLGLRAQYKEPV